MCTVDLATLSPFDTVADAMQLMNEHAVRRVPVVDGGRPVGIVSLADLALHADPEVARRIPGTLAGISAAPSDDPPTEVRPKVSAALERDQAGRPGQPA